MWANVLRHAGIALFAFIWLAVGLLAAQENKDAGPPEEKVVVLPFWDTDRGSQVRAEWALIGAGNLYGALGTRVAISENVPELRVWQFVFDKALPLDQRYLDAIRDKRKLPDLRFIGLDELKGPDLGMYLALTEAIRRSHRASMEMFENSADDNKHVVFANLNTNSPQYRGKIITVTGNLTVIRKVEAPRLIKHEFDFVYTGYILGPTKGAPPYTVVFTQLPDGLDVSEKVNADVTFYGYYLGLIRFEGDKKAGQKDVVSPYLVGKTLIVNKKAAVIPPEEETSYSYFLIVLSLGIFVGVGAFGFVMIIWFRRGDHKTQSHLAELRDRQRPFSLGAEEPVEGPPAAESAESANGANPPPAP